MLEINRSFELTEMKKPTADGFKCIEPQSKMTSHEAQKYWDSKFDKENNPVKYGGGSYEGRMRLTCQDQNWRLMRMWKRTICRPMQFLLWIARKDLASK